MWLSTIKFCHFNFIVNLVGWLVFFVRLNFSFSLTLSLLLNCHDHVVIFPTGFILTCCYSAANGFGYALEKLYFICFCHFFYSALDVYHRISISLFAFCQFMYDHLNFVCRRRYSNIFFEKKIATWKSHEQMNRSINLCRVNGSLQSKFALNILNWHGNCGELCKI